MSERRTYADIEWLPWDAIPADRKREGLVFREVLGFTFHGEEAWLPWMGEP